jgi:hypothetical protein
MLSGLLNITKVASTNYAADWSTGEIPREIGNLKSLMELSLEYNQLKGRSLTPSELCQSVLISDWMKVHYPRRWDF